MKLKTIARTIKTLGKGVTMGIDPAVDASDPFELFQEWFADAEGSGLVHPEAMALATASPEGAPSVRIVLLKELDDAGFVFYTNHESRKGGELLANPKASVVFHWASLERQVRVEGVVEPVSREQATVYFHSRPRGSQIGAWASRQSRDLAARTDLEARVQEFTQKFEGGDVPLPDFWGGFRIRPARIEFWQGRTSRLHDRLVFEATDYGWVTRRLYP
ncbi:MAG: pyridoxamine 5'-phosphate oxidase [Rhodothermales bacterium]|jgi:pyridoxamine 5'-phosphate oxidase